MTARSLTRDRLTWLTYALLGAYGYFIYGFGSTVSLLRDEQGVGRTVSGLHGTALAAGSMLSAFLVAAAVRRFGRGPTMWVGLAGLCLGIVCYLATSALPLTLTGALLAGFFGSLVVVPVSAVLSDHHGQSGAAAISEGNAVAAGVGTVAPLLVGGAVAVGLGWRVGLAVLVPIALVIYLVGRHEVFPLPPAERGVPLVGGNRLPPRYWIGWAAITAAIAAEFCMTLWTADILRDRFGLSSAVAAAGLFTVVAGMCLGRVLGGRLALRLETGQLLHLATGVAAAGFAVFWLTTWPPLALVALLVIGLGLSVLYPLGIARAIDLSEGRPDQATARAGIGASIAAGGGPFVLGAVADQVGIHGAFLVVPVLLGIVVIGVALSTPRRLVA